jgi:TetR/AcrR family transcriptional regulator, ethionamide resistance regulator
MATAQQSAATRSARGRRPQRATGDERERAILKTAERLLGERPLSEISVDDLARGAGISRPTFYFYFSSKEAVLLALLDRVAEEATAARDSALDVPPDDPMRRLREGIRGTFETFRAHRAVMMAAADARAGSPEISNVWTRVMEGFVSGAADAIEQARAGGLAPEGVPARQLAIALNLMNERVLHATFAGYAPSIPEDEVVDALAGVWFSAIVGRPVPAVN